MAEAQKAQALVEWLKSFVERIGLTARWSGKGIDSAMLDTLTDDVFAYMGRPVQQYRPVFTRAEIRQQYEKALVTP
jgi:alcohol dehydrogenase class IV